MMRKKRAGARVSSTEVDQYFHEPEHGQNAQQWHQGIEKHQLEKRGYAHTQVYVAIGPEIDGMSE
jgi:hypothetical protein